MNICLRTLLPLSVLYLVLLSVTNCWTQRGLKHCYSLIRNYGNGLLDYTLFCEH